MRFELEGDKADVRMTSLAAYVVSAATAPAILIFVHLVAHIGWGRAALAVGLSLGLSLFELGQEILRSRLRVITFMIGSVLRSAFAFVVCIVIAELGGGGLGQLAGAATAYYLAAAFNCREIWRGPRAPIDVGKLKLFFWLGLFGDRGGIPLHLPAFARPSVHRLAVRRQRGGALWRVGGRRQTDHSHSGGQCRSGGVSVDRARLRHRMRQRKRVASSSAPPAVAYGAGASGRRPRSDRALPHLVPARPGVSLDCDGGDADPRLRLAVPVGLADLHQRQFPSVVEAEPVDPACARGVERQRALPVAADLVFRPARRRVVAR